MLYCHSMSCPAKPYTVPGGDSVAYKIQYNPEYNRKYPGKIKHKRPWKPVAVLLVLVAVLLAAYKDSVMALLRPGDGERANDAVAVFVDEIRAGEGFHRAATAFCRQILNDEAP